MLIQESDLGRMNGLNLLQNMAYLSEGSVEYDAFLAPLVEVNKTGTNIISLEGVTRFCWSKDINDVSYALAHFCESSNVDPANIIFSVEETSIIADDKMAELVSSIMNEGCDVVAVPISSYDPLNELACCAVEASLNGDDSLLEAYANLDFAPFLEAHSSLHDRHAQVLDKMYGDDYDKLESGIKDKFTGLSLKKRKYQHKFRRLPGVKQVRKGFLKIGRGIKTIKNNPGKTAAAAATTLAGLGYLAHKKGLFNRGTDTKAEDVFNPGEEKAAATEDKVVTLISQAEEKKDPNFIARAIASLRNWAEKVEANNSDPDGVWSSVKLKIAQAIKFLTTQLQKMKMLNADA